VDRVVYGCMDVDDVLLASIRSDPGVEVVWRDGRVEIEESKGAEDFDGDDVEVFGVRLRDALGP
jgi:hypothetical protein